MLSQTHFDTIRSERVKVTLRRQSGVVDADDDDDDDY